ncbi:STAS domain-containing protein [Actinoplanes aureus]|uniref:Anti-sigma factor antagonist n=1 Tax=Actinoplanes aureus TaxID=2792083 RepID=A0A931FXG7_9ACTN|nr:STAS domain-containing protein [Actinoplanes aureus]MBG0562470.1 STAS domain-containing protein [Actinoplanes aureus]
MSFDCTIERTGDSLVVFPEGDLDINNAAVLRQVLQQVLDRRDCAHVEVDMSAVTFLDSSGLGMLVAARRAAEAQGATLRLRAPGPMVRMVLEVTNLYQQFVVEEPGEAAARTS